MNTRRHFDPLTWILALLCVGGVLARAQTVEVGGIARDFTIINRATGSPVHLSDYAGQVVLLDFFAYWCGPCQASSPDVELNIKEYYAARGGNAHGVPVSVLSVNVDSSNESATDSFIVNAGLDAVFNDYERSAYNEFQNGSIPLFAVINCVDESPSHLQWEVLYRDAGYPGATALRAVIDSVEAADPTAPPHVVLHPVGQTQASGKALALDVRATGSRPLRYQWYKNGVPLAAATNSTFVRASALPADSGTYAVDVMNGFGTNRSANAQVHVVPSGSAASFTYTGSPVSIPDTGTTARSTIPVPSTLEVLELAVSLNITHTFRGDLYVVLVSPSGTRVVLSSYSSDSGDNLVFVNSPVAGFLGQPAKGNWVLEITDGYAGDAGTLQGWSLRITPPGATLPQAFSTWMAGFGSIAPAQRAAEADPDNDGIPNILEYLLAGHSPEAAARGPLLSPSASNPGYLEYALNWRDGAETSACTVWVCDDLAAGSWREAGSTNGDITVDRTTPGRLAVRCRQALPRLYLQLRVDTTGL